MKRIFNTALLLFLILPGLMAQYTDIGEIEGDTAAGRFGTSSALNYDGSMLIAGAYAIAGGKAQVFEWTNNNWVQRGNDITGTGQFGWSVDMNAAGDMVVISAKDYNPGGTNPDQGQVKVYEWDGSSWNQKGSELLGPTAGDEYGYDVAMDSTGMNIVIGSPSYDFLNADGLVEVYEWDGSDWSERGTGISSPTTAAGTGLAVDISADGNTIAYSIPGRGEAAVREWIDTSWTLVGQTLSGSTQASFGNDVQLSYDGKTVAVGAPTVDTDLGAAEVYKWLSNSWTGVGTIDGLNNGNFSGSTIALSRDGDFLAIGSRYANLERGHIKVYYWDGTSFVNYDQTINAGGDDTGDEFSRSIAMNYNGSIMCGGAHKHNPTAGPDAGIVKVYKACLGSDVWPGGSGLTTTELSYASYQWLDCDNGNAPISGATDAAFEPAEDGNYAVEVTSMGCTDTSACAGFIALGVDNQLLSNSFNIFPNPGNGRFYINFTEGVREDVALTVYNSLGQQVIDAQNIDEGTSTFTLDMGQLQQGTYFVQLTGEQSTTTKKLVLYR